MEEEKSMRSVSLKTIRHLLNVKVQKVGEDVKSLKELNAQYNEATARVNFLQDLGLINYNEIEEVMNRIDARYISRALKLEE